MAATKLKVLLVLSHVHVDGEDVGEALVGYNWAKEIAKRCDVTILTQTRKGHKDPAKQFPECEVITWPTIELPARFERVNALMKPGYPIFVRRVRKWIKSALKNGRNFDVIHQLNPIGVRYAPASSEYNIPYIFGPAGGSLTTPSTFADEIKSASWYTKLRIIDHLRFKYDPFLRNAYKKIDLLIGVGGYVEANLGTNMVKKFLVQTELGLNTLKLPRKNLGVGETLNILHVGRAVRTKGLRDAVRAMAHLKDKDIHLVSAGGGEELDICKLEAQQLGVSNNITFHGNLPHSSIMELYDDADLFVFPSFREPSGGVVYEAIGEGIPVLIADRGGPGDYIKDGAGIKVEVTDPKKFSWDIAQEISKVYKDRKLLSTYADNGYTLMKNVGLWDKKMDWLMETYHEVITDFKQRNQ